MPCASDSLRFGFTTNRGSAECIAVCEEYHLHRCVHFIAGIAIPTTASVCPLSRVPIEDFYASLGVSTVLTVADGDCVFDVMTMMLARPRSFENRKTLRVEISDYLLDRIGEPWMIELLEACQELSKTDVADTAVAETTVAQSPSAPTPV